MPEVAPELAVALNAEVLLLLADTVSKALGVASAVKELWNVASELFRVPRAEIWVVIADSCELIRFCCGVWVAETSCETSELTLMTEPPAAPALELLAMETTPLPEVEEVELMV